MSSQQVISTRLYNFSKKIFNDTSKIIYHRPTYYTWTSKIFAIRVSIDPDMLENYHQLYHSNRKRESFLKYLQKNAIDDFEHTKSTIKNKITDFLDLMDLDKIDYPSIKSIDKSFDNYVTNEKIFEFRFEIGFKTKEDLAQFELILLGKSLTE